MTYYVKMEDVDRLGSQELLEYKNKMQEASESLTSYIKTFASSNAIEGQAGESMKRYMLEVHGPLMQNLIGAIGQLLTDYSNAYLGRYQQGETGGDVAGAFPESGLSQTIDHLQGIKHSSLSDAGSWLRSAAGHIPAGCSVSIPKVNDATEDYDREISKARQLREYVGTVESDGKRAFTTDMTCYQNLMASLKEALVLCAGGAFSISSYRSGMFSTIATSTGLRDSYQAAMADQAKKADATAAILTNSLNDTQERERLAIEEAAKEKEKHAWWGIAMEAGLFVLGAVALVGTAGAATPALFLLGAAMGGAGLYSSAKGIESRLQQIVDMKTDPGADRKDSKIAGLSDAKKAGKVTKDALKVEHEAKKAPDLARKKAKAAANGYWQAYDKLSEESQKLSKESLGMVSDVGKIGIDYLWDSATSGIEDEGAKLKTDVTKEAVDAGYDIVSEKIIEGSLKGGSVTKVTLGFAFNAGQAVADYNVGQCDKRIDQSQATIDKTEGLKQTLGGQAPSPAVSW